MLFRCLPALAAGEDVLMRQRFQFRLSVLFWAAFIVAVFLGSWHIARYWSNSDQGRRVYVAAAISVWILVAAYAFVIRLNTPLDD